MLQIDGDSTNRDHDALKPYRIDPTLRWLGIGLSYTLVKGAGIMAEGWLQRAKRYRDRAEEMRILAEDIKQRDAKEAFGRVATEYDVLAAQAERTAQEEKRWK